MFKGMSAQVPYPRAAPGGGVIRLRRVPYPVPTGSGGSSAVVELQSRLLGCAARLFPPDAARFGPTVPASLRVLLNKAVSVYEDTARAEALLWQAQRMNPGRLEVYVALYTFYFHKCQLEAAENVAWEALERAAEQAGVTPDWARFNPACADWCRPHGPERACLHTLKALGFIRLRRLDFAGGEAILDKLMELDPEDRLGGAVLLDLATVLREIVEHVARRR